MKKIIITGLAAAIVTLLILPALIAQTQAEPEQNSSNRKPAQMVNNEFFKVSNVSFNKKIDNRGKGEMLQVEFEIDNLTDVPQELYIHVFATDEHVVWKHNTFYHAIEDDDGNMLLNLNKEQGRNIRKQNIDIRYFSSDPDDKSNYEYQIDGKTKLMKYPKNIKAGIDPVTSAAYKLEDKYVYRNAFLCEYRKRYKYFNHVTILIFDDEEKLLYRQIWSLDGRRH